MNLDNAEEEVDVTYINSTTETNNIYMNDDYNVSHKYVAPLFSSNDKKYVSTGTEYDWAKRRFRLHEKNILDLLLKTLNIFERKVSLLLFVLNGKK